MADAIVDEFGQKLVVHVRDRAMRSCNALIAFEGSGGPTATRWQALMSLSDPRQMATALIPEIVDDVIFYLLDAIDNGLLQVYVRKADGEYADLNDIGLGELAGWYAGGEWLRRFSKERLAGSE